MRTILAGSRHLVDHATFQQAVESCPWWRQISEVVSGAARGADTLGEQWARWRGLPVRRFPAQWDTYGRSAGYRRNVQMAEHADALIAMPMGESRGTRHMIRIAQERGLRVWVVEIPTQQEHSLWSVDAPHFNAGLVTRNGTCIKAAPILHWAVGQTREQLRGYFQRKGWAVEWVCDLDEAGKPLSKK